MARTVPTARGRLKDDLDRAVLEAAGKFGRQPVAARAPPA
jgi:hypothetical protein